MKGVFYLAIEINFALNLTLDFTISSIIVM